MKYKAIFFDRDGTLTYLNPLKRQWYKETMEAWSGKKFELSYEEMMALFDSAGYPKEGLKSINQEKQFWLKYYEKLLMREGIRKDIDEKANMLLNELWCNHDKCLYPEVIEVLEYFKNKGYKIGVISDTSPSLQLSLENLGLGKYIDSYMCSDLVGVMKPDPAIFEHALKSLDVKAESCIYVDDYDVEADGARAVGFTSFNIVRDGEINSSWQIGTLTQIIDYIEKQD